MPKIRHIGRSDVHERDLFSTYSPDLALIPHSLSMPSRHFVAFLAVDATGIDAAALAEFARKLLRGGCVYFCAWGADCERVHDIFDSECLAVDPVIITTWHSEDSLDEALWFFVFSAYPDDGYWETTRSSLAISVGRPEWDEQIRRRLANLDSLNREVVHGA